MRAVNYVRRKAQHHPNRDGIAKLSKVRQKYPSWYAPTFIPQITLLFTMLTFEIRFGYLSGASKLIGNPRRDLKSIVGRAVPLRDAILGTAIRS